MTSRELKAIAVARDDYGVWNNAGAWRRYYEARRAELYARWPAPIAWLLDLLP